MSDFRVEFKGLDELRELLNPDYIKSSIAKTIGNQTIKLASLLRTEVHNYYTFSGNIDTFREGKSTSIVKTGKHTIESSIVYKDTPLPLHKFAFETSTVPADNRFIIKRGRAVQVIDRGSTKQLLVKVRRKAGYKMPFNRKKQPGFYLKAGDSSKWRYLQGGSGGSSYPTGIYARLQPKTWKGPARTNFLQRSPIQLMYGPSIGTMIRATYRNNPKVSILLDSIPEKVFRGLY